jgi:tetratricopeptide (TPR) repeat protein
VNMGGAYEAMARYEISLGLYPAFSLEKASAGYEKAIQINPKDALYFNHLGDVHRARGGWEIDSGQNPSTSLENAARYYLQSADLNQKSGLPENGLGITYVEQARYKRLRGMNPASALTEAGQHFRKAIQIRTDDWHPYLFLARGYEIQAQYDIDEGRDPSVGLKEAALALEKILAVNPRECAKGQASLELTAARWEVRKGRSPKAHLEAGAQAIRKARNMDPDDPGLILLQAQGYRWEAEGLILLKKPAGEVLREGMTLVDRYLKARPDEAGALCLKGILTCGLFGEERDPRRKNELKNQARALLEKALYLNSNLKLEAEAYLKHLR